MPADPIPAAEVEAAAEALAALHIDGRSDTPFSYYGAGQQNDFRKKARAALEAARKVREGRDV